MQIKLNQGLHEVRPPEMRSLHSLVADTVSALGDQIVVNCSVCIMRVLMCPDG